jgi:hypothetical protein
VTLFRSLTGHLSLLYVPRFLFASPNRALFSSLCSPFPLCFP